MTSFLTRVATTTGRRGKGGWEMCFRMGHRGKCNVSKQPNYFRLASKLQNMLFGVLRLRARRRAQVWPELMVV